MGTVLPVTPTSHQLQPVGGFTFGENEQKMPFQQGHGVGGMQT